MVATAHRAHFGGGGGGIGISSVDDGGCDVYDDRGTAAAAARTTTAEEYDCPSHPCSSPSRSGKRRTVVTLSVLSAAAFVCGTAVTLLGLGGSSSSSRRSPAAITPHPRALRKERERVVDGRRGLMQSTESVTVETETETTEATSTTMEIETDAQKASKVKGTLSAIRQEKEFLKEQIALAGGSLDEMPSAPVPGSSSGGSSGGGDGDDDDGEVRPPTAAQKVQSSNKSAVSYVLARGQSFGFFNDVPDRTWEVLRTRALDQPSHANADEPLADADRPNRWYGKNWEPNFTCANERRVGGLTAPDGPKWVCNPHRIGTYSRERVAGGGPGCLVYSFGSMGYYGFEEGLLNIIGGDGGNEDGKPGCEVHVFDENPPRDDDGKVKEVPPGIVLHPWGLKPENDDGWASSSVNADPSKYTYRSLRETVETLGHRHRVVDVFKIDCEGCEWVTYEDWFDAGLDIRQLLVETHGVPENANDFFERLRSEGYVTFHKEPNTWSAGGACQEYAFVKLDQGFFRRH